MISASARERLLETAKKVPSHLTYGLCSELQLALGIKYMVTVNISVADGIFNGAVGTLMLVETGEGAADVVRVWLLFDNPTVGQQTRQTYKDYAAEQHINPTWTPIDHTSKTIQLKKSTRSLISRKQLPIVCAESMTIHKSQGGTYESVVVTLKKGMSLNQLYVAFSRVTKLSGLYLKGSFHPPAPSNATNLVRAEMTRLFDRSPVQFTSQEVNSSEDPSCDSKNGANVDSFERLYRIEQAPTG